MEKKQMDVEEKLMKSLGSKGLKTDQLKKLSARFAAFKKQGLLVDKVLINGQPRPDKIFVRGIVKPDFLVKFKQMEYASKLEFFPIGTINPDQFGFNIAIDMKSLLKQL